MTVNKKRVFGYFVYSFGFILLLVLISNINVYYIKRLNEYFHVFPYRPWEIFILLMYIPIGIYLGLPKFLTEFNKTGRWTINFHKIMLLALPMLYISFYWYFPISCPLPDVLTHTKTLFNFGTLLTGFFLITSFTKK